MACSDMYLRCVRVEKRKRKMRGAPEEMWPYVGNSYTTQSFDCYVVEVDRNDFSVPMSQRRYELLAYLAGIEWEERCVGYNVRFCHVTAVPVNPEMLIWVDDGTDGPRYPRRLATLFDAQQQDTSLAHLALTHPFPLTYSTIINHNH